MCLITRVVFVECQHDMGHLWRGMCHGQGCHETTAYVQRLTVPMQCPDCAYKSGRSSSVLFGVVDSTGHITQLFGPIPQAGARGQQAGGTGLSNWYPLTREVHDQNHSGNVPTAGGHAAAFFNHGTGKTGNTRKAGNRNRNRNRNRKSGKDAKKAAETAGALLTTKPVVDTVVEQQTSANLVTAQNQVQDTDPALVIPPTTTTKLSDFTGSLSSTCHGPDGGEARLESGPIIKPGSLGSTTTPNTTHGFRHLHQSAAKTGLDGVSTIDQSGSVHDKATISKTDKGKGTQTPQPATGLSKSRHHHPGAEATATATATADAQTETESVTGPKTPPTGSATRRLRRMPGLQNMRALRHGDDYRGVGIDLPHQGHRDISPTPARRVVPSAHANHVDA